MWLIFLINFILVKLNICFSDEYFEIYNNYQILDEFDNAFSIENFNFKEEISCLTRCANLELCTLVQFNFNDNKCEFFSIIDMEHFSIQFNKLLNNKIYVKLNKPSKPKVKEINGKLIKTLKNANSNVYFLSTISTGFLISGSENELRIWNQETENVLKTFRTSDIVLSIINLENGYIAYGQKDGKIIIREIFRNSIFKEINDHSHDVKSLVLLKNGNFISGSEDKSIKLWNSYGIFQKNVELNFLPVFSLALYNNYNYLVSGYFNGVIRIRNLFNGSIVRELSNGHTSSVYALKILQNGFLASGSIDKSIIIWNLYNITIIKKINNLDEVWSLEVLSNGNLASGYLNGSISIWNNSNWILIKTLEAHTAKTRALYVLPNGKLVSGSLDATIKIWE